MSGKIGRLRALLAACVFFGALLATSAAHAATFTVTKEADTADGTCDSDCSLREAIIAANAAPGADTVTVPAGHYTLTRDGAFENNSQTGDLDITGSTTLTGAGARSTVIDGNGIDRVIDIPDSPIFLRSTRGALPIAVAISGVKITGGQAPSGDGGGIAVTNPSASLSLTDSTVDGNVAALGKGGGRGGGIYSERPLEVTGSTISNNQANQGGGVYLQGSGGSATFTNDTITANVVDSFNNVGGGVEVQTPGPVRFLNTTIAGNSVSSNATPGAPATLATSGPGGGIGAPATTQGGPPDISATNTIVALNSPNDCENPIGSGGHNLESATTCGFTGSGDRPNTDPKLGSLANNGGPTDTLALLPGSPAIDAADNSKCPGTDQRGVTRPQGPVCDIGAFEVKAATDLSIKVGDSPDPVVLGHTLTYKVTGTNNGSGSDPNVKITDQLPASVQFLSADPSQGECSHSGSKVTCQIGTLPGTSSGAGAAGVHASAANAATVTIRVRPKKLGNIKDLVTISGSASETTTANNTATAHTRVLERNRPHITLSGIPRGCVTRDFTVTVHISDQSAVRSRVLLDGHSAGTTTRKTFRLRIRASRIGSGRHTLTVRAVDHYGNRAQRSGTFRRCRRAVQPHFTG